jgi:hypothetical protein
VSLKKHDHAHLNHTSLLANLMTQGVPKSLTRSGTGIAVAFIISELPGERAEALFIAMAALVPTAGEHSEIQIEKVGAPEPRATFAYFGRSTP